MNDGSNIFSNDFCYNNFNKIGFILGYEDYNPNGWGNVEKSVIIKYINYTFIDIDNNNYSFIIMNWIPNTQDGYLLNYEGIWKYHNNGFEFIKEIKGLYLISISNMDHSLLISSKEKLFYYNNGLFTDLKDPFESSLR
jgi:hypothetical protein